MKSQVSQPNSASVIKAYRHCTEIAGRGIPNLFLAARFFKAPEIFDAFCAAYASMRIIDDVVDGLPDRESQSDEQKQQALEKIHLWLANVHTAFSLKPDNDPIWRALADTFSKFDLPTDPWEDLAGAMAMDIETPYFKDWRSLQKYMGGASVAPAVVFMHLVLTRLEDEEYICQWSYDEVVEATEDLAIFCYWTHILRDISRDLEIGEKGLIYVPLSELNQFGLAPDDLRRMKQEGNATFAFKAMAEHLFRRARQHEQKGRQHLMKVAKVAADDDAFALDFLIDIYSATLDKIEKIDFDVFAEDGELSIEEKREILKYTAMECEADLDEKIDVFESVYGES
jgi:phytoene synthase